MTININNNSGFTLVEILMVMVIVIVIASLGLFVGADFYRDYAFRSDRDVAVSVLQRARARSLANINGSPHGVYIDSDGYAIFQGASYATRDSSLDEFIAFNPGMSASGLDEVVFSRLTGETSTAGDITITNGFKSAAISVNSEGRINY